METIVPSFSPNDFGKAARDYAAYRKGFPPSFFKRLLQDGIGKPGQKILDIGTGTGTLARGFAKQGAAATGLDISPELIAEAQDLGKKEGVSVGYVRSKAESTPFESGSFDVVTAGQCWLWFKGPAAAKECLRVLKPGGVLVIAHFSYLAEQSDAASQTEDLILQHNPSWPLAGTDGRYGKWRAHMEPAGFADLKEYDYDEDIPYTHEEWRGRMRACNGVLALKNPDRIRQFDQDLERLLKKDFPLQPLKIPHRVFVLSGRKP